MKTSLRLGTRKSLLAMAQSRWVAQTLQNLNPGLNVELVGITTQGDIVLNKPLSQIEGKEFFVAELDRALLRGEVDFTVHSLKDLSTERPAAIASAAMPQRENPSDLAIFGPNALARLRSGAELLIGTSSPRRLENIPPILERTLPYLKSPSLLKFQEIRGNVNTRLARVHALQESSEYLDGVILARAGLERLLRDPSASVALAPLLQGVFWMELPLSLNPTAPGQGALAIECRTDDPHVFKVLQTIEDPSSREDVQYEREQLVRYGGGCHQRFGSTRVEQKWVGKIQFTIGKTTDGRILDDVTWNSPRAKSAAQFF